MTKEKSRIQKEAEKKAKAELSAALLALFDDPKPSLTKCEKVSEALKILFPKFQYVEVFNGSAGWNCVRLCKVKEAQSPIVLAYVWYEPDEKKLIARHFPKGKDLVEQKWGRGETLGPGVTDFLKKHLRK